MVYNEPGRASKRNVDRVFGLYYELYVQVSITENSCEAMQLAKEILKGKVMCGIIAVSQLYRMELTLMKFIGPNFYSSSFFTSL
jgi:hypothetical protein